jgi:hypothetical protein
MCTTSAECKTVITAVLTVKSGMDPQGFWLVLVQLLSVPVGAGISWLNRAVGAGDSVGSYLVGAGDSLSCYPIGAGCS